MIMERNHMREQRYSWDEIGIPLKQTYLSLESWQNHVLHHRGQSGQDVLVQETKRNIRRHVGSGNGLRSGADKVATDAQELFFGTIRHDERVFRGSSFANDSGILLWWVSQSRQGMDRVNVAS